MATRATASVTLAWSAGIVATVRYYQLAAPTAATPAVPTSSSSLGSWSETEPTTDVTKVLWTCERTVYADGTESWSKASKSTSYEAAKDAKSTANTAKSTADTAKSTADSAKTAAGDAQSTADTAVSNAAKAQSSADRAQGTADDAWARTLRVEVMSAPADADGDTSLLTAYAFRGGELLSDEAVARMGLLAWYVGGSRVATGGTYTCAAGTAAECRLEA